jgi:hypothetical protein
MDGKVMYLQFLEGSYVTATSLGKDGSWTVPAEPDAAAVQV